MALILVLMPGLGPGVQYLFVVGVRRKGEEKKKAAFHTSRELRFTLGELLFNKPTH